LGGKEKVRVKQGQASASTETELEPVFKVQKKYWPVSG